MRTAKVPTTLIGIVLFASTTALLAYSIHAPWGQRLAVLGVVGPMFTLLGPGLHGTTPMAFSWSRLLGDVLLVATLLFASAPRELTERFGFAPGATTAMQVAWGVTAMLAGVIVFRNRIADAAAPEEHATAA